jgi:putative ABC transport system permease protein
MTAVRFALRALRKNPGFTVVAIATLALGIGANTAIFGAFYTVLLQPPPYPQPDQLRIVQPVLLADQGPSDTLGYWSYPMFKAFSETDHGLEAVAAFTPYARAYNLAGVDAPARVRVEMVSASYFPLLGVKPALGRTFLPEEDAIPGEAPVALIAYDLWTGLFGADSSLVGRTISLNSISFTVLGVLPPGFAGLSGQADVWVPMMMAPALTFANRLRGATSFWHYVVGRTVAGAPNEVTAARLSAAATAVDEQIPLRQVFGDVRLDFVSRPLAEAQTDPAARTALTVLMGAVVFVLLIVCVNLTNLLLTQTAKRRRELGVRLALGARRSQIARQLVIESTVLALLGGGGGILVAVWGLALLGALAPAAAWEGIHLTGLSLNTPALIFNFAVAAATGLAIGAAPALRASEHSLARLLRDGDRSVASRVGPRGLLVTVQVALALILLTGAGLMLESLARLRSAPLGFDPDGLLTVNIELPTQAYSDAETVRFLDEAAQRMAALPGARAATVGNCLPLAGHCDRVRMAIQGEVRPPDAPGHEVWINMVDGDYFRSLGIPLRAGRSFESADRPDAPRVAIVSEAAARAYWPGRDPIGARIQLSVGWEDWAEVIGVVGDTPTSSLKGASQPGVYLPYAQFIYSSNYLVLATNGDPLLQVGAVRDAVAQIDPDLPLWDVQTMGERIAGSLAPTRFSAVLLGLAAGLATLLAAIGVFAVMAFNVAGRSREIGMRIALGATSVGVMRLVISQAMRFALTGLGAGLVAALLLTRTLSSQLYEVHPGDPRTFAVVATLLALVTLVAAYLPARRAARIDPVDALRDE